VSRKIQENYNFLLSRLLAYVIINLFFILKSYLEYWKFLPMPVIFGSVGLLTVF
jgi:hypothetical protein